MGGCGYRDNTLRVHSVFKTVAVVLHPVIRKKGLPILVHSGFIS